MQTVSRLGSGKMPGGVQLLFVGPPINPDKFLLGAPLTFNLEL